MPLKILQGNISNFGDYKFELADGKVVFMVEISDNAALDKLASIIPGGIDDAIIGLVKTALPALGA